jgi:NodT family efflux transporter outer membrane factor (OMF) lipoprotein
MCVSSNRNTWAFESRTACSGLLLPLYAIFLFGCAVGPDFVPPGVQVPSAWEGASPLPSPVLSATVGAPEDCVEWWKSFNDPLLTSLIERAFESNLDLRQARAARRVGTASFWPTVDGFAEANLAAKHKTADITRQRYERGLVSGHDAANANAQMATTASRIPVLESSVRETIHTLGVLLGSNPTALLEEIETATPIATIPPEVTVGLPSDLLRRRPDIRTVEAQTHAATARIGVATADLFPQFSLSGSLSFSGETFSAMADWSSRAWSIGPGMEWRIFDAGRIRWNIELQKALQEQSLLAYQQTVLTALKDVETAMVAYAKEQVHNSLLNEAVRENRKAVELARTPYTVGQTDFLNVLSAQGALFVSEEALALSTRALSVNLVALY